MKNMKDTESAVLFNALHGDIWLCGVPGAIGIDLLIWSECWASTNRLSAVVRAGIHGENDERIQAHLLVVADAMLT